MTIATDPNDVTVTDSDDDFDKHFKEFASGNKPDPVPEEREEGGEPEGNGPEDDAYAPADEAATEHQPRETATSGSAKPEGGAPPPSGEQAPDLWANAPPELIAERERLQRERDEAQHRANSDANRVAALSRKLQQFTTAQPATAPEAKPEELSEAKKALDAKIKDLRENYPEIADPIIEVIEAQRQELQGVRTVLDGMTETQQAQTIEAETHALEARHPDWRDVASSVDWKGWLEVQPDNIQRLATSWDARETSVALSLFKAERIEASGQRQEAPPEPAPTADAATGARRSQQLEGGRDVRSRPAPAASGPPEDFGAAFEYYAEKKRLASNRR